MYNKTCKNISDIEHSYDLLCNLLNTKIIVNSQSSNEDDGTRSRQIDASIPDSGTTHFSARENTVIVETKETKVIKSLDTHLLHGDDLSIVKFLQRPYLLNSGNFATTDTATTFGTFEWGINTQVAMLKEKLNGVLILKATLVVEITFNANRFQAGRYLLAYVPTGGNRTSVSTNTNWVNMRRFTKRQVTQLPHVQFDLNTTKGAVLRIPWASAHNGCLVTPSPSFTNPGHVFLYPYVPLVSTAGSTTVGYNIFTHFEDIVLGGATIPQSGMDTLDAEVRTKGPIEGGASIVSDISGALNTIPFLSSVAGPVKWVSDLVGNVAHVFGWSKPIILTEQSRVVRNAHPFMASADAHSNALPLSLVSTNHVGVAAGFAGTDLDEMSIDYLKGIKTWFGTVTITTAQTYGTLVSTIDCHPNVATTTVNDGTVALISMSPLAYLANIHTYYTGSLNFHLKFVKTEFHTGRLAVAFIPYEGDTTQPTVTVGNTPYVHRDIIDLSQGNEWNFNFPFISTTPWRETKPASGAYGRLSIFIVDPLVAPATVATSISMIVEISGGDDMQFAGPDGVSYAAVVPSAPQSGMALLEAEARAIGNSRVQRKSFAACEESQGQAITSLRQHLKRGDYVSDQFILTTTQASYIMPFLWQPQFSNGTTLTGAPTMDIYSVLSASYALSRGGVRVRIIPRGPSDSVTIGTSLRYFNQTTPSFTMTNNPLVNYVNQTYAAWKTLANGSGNSREQMNTGGFEVQVPQSTATISRISSANTVTNTATYSYAAQLGDRAIISVDFSDLSTATDDRYFEIYRSGADDCNFGLFCGIPPLRAASLAS